MNQRELAISLPDICLYCGAEIAVDFRFGGGHHGEHLFCDTPCKTKFFHLSKNEQSLARLVWSRMARAARLIAGTPAPATAQERVVDRKQTTSHVKQKRKAVKEQSE